MSDPAPSGGDSEGEESGPSRDPVPAVSSENHLRAFIKKWLEANAEATMHNIGECQAKYKEEQGDAALWRPSQNVRLGVLYKEALAVRAQMPSSPVVHARKLVEAAPGSTMKPTSAENKWGRAQGGGENGRAGSEAGDEMAEAFCLKAQTVLLGPDDDFVGISVWKRFEKEKGLGVFRYFEGTVTRKKMSVKGEKTLFHVEYKDDSDCEDDCEDMSRVDIKQLLMQVWVGVRVHHCLLVDLQFTTHTEHYLAPLV